MNDAPVDVCPFCGEELDRCPTCRGGNFLRRGEQCREVAANVETANSYLLAMALSGLSRHISGDTMGKIFEKLTVEMARRVRRARLLVPSSSPASVASR